MIEAIATIAVCLIIIGFVWLFCRACRQHEIEESRKYPVIGRRYE